MKNMPEFRIVIDTTELFSNPRLEGPSFGILKSFLSRTESCLLVPQVIIDESVNHFRNRIQKLVAEANDGVREINRLTLSNFPSIPTDADDETQNYLNFLLSTLKRMGAKIIPYNAVSVEKIATRSLSRKKPFDGEGKKGFRDAIVWESLLHQIRGEDFSKLQYILISNNTRDFGETDAADDLKVDLDSIGGAIQLKLFSRLSDFVDKQVKPWLKQLDEMGAVIENGEFHGFQLADFFSEEWDSISDELKEPRHWYQIASKLESKSNYHSFKLRKLEDQCSAFEVVDTWLVDTNSIVVGVDFLVAGLVDCVESHDEYYGDGDEFGIEEVHEDRQVQITLKVLMSITLGKDDGLVLDFEVNDFELQ